MKSNLAKVMHPVCGRPMLGYSLDLAKSLKASKVVVVLGYQHQQVRKFIPSGTAVVLQKQLKGTADAVKCALPLLKNFKGTVLILYADSPLLRKDTIDKLLKHHIGNSLDATLLTATVGKPAGYGRVLRDKYESISGIIEDKDADEFQKDISEINTGIVCFKKDSLTRAIKQVLPNNRKKEYYLTDVIDILYKYNRLIENVSLEDIDEALGINSRVDLAKANAIMQQRINRGLMEQGVTICDPATTFINYGTKIGTDSVIYPFTVIERNVKIGKRCSVGPFIHLREDTCLDNDVLVGNFLEITRSKIGTKTFIKHFSYIGDTNIGKAVNIGAGTVTANFNGKQKNLTVIKNRAFIGSDTVLVAPVKIGKAAMTAAGSVVTKNNNVADGQMVAGVPAKPFKKARLNG